MTHVGALQPTLVLLLGCALASCAAETGSDGKASGPSGNSSGGSSNVSSGGASTTAGASTGASSSTGGTSSNSGSGAIGGVPVGEDPPPADCGLDSPAFCENFESPAPGGRGGDLDESKWAFSRWGHSTVNFFNRVAAYSEPPGLNFENEPPTLCGELFAAILPPDDAKICPGKDGASNQFNELFQDNTGLAVNSFMLRKPFDFADRTGKIVFDVDAKINPRFDGPGWWVEIWITDRPGPLPYHGAPTLAPYPENGIGFRFDAAGTPRDTCRVEHVFVSKGHKIVLESFVYDNIQFKTEDGVLNHFELELSQDKFEMFATDAGDPDSLRSVGTMDGLELAFTRGYIHFQHAHYNANKHCCGDPCVEECNGTEGEDQVQGSWSSPAQVYRWDNIGFDGPNLPLLRTYDVPDALEPFDQDNTTYMRTGYELSEARTFQIENVDLTDASSATFDFNVDNMEPGMRVQYRFNGHDWHVVTTPVVLEANLMRTYSSDVPLGELVNGTNSVEIELLDSADSVGNLDLSIHQ
jgi:hypothetical protein